MNEQEYTVFFSDGGYQHNEDDQAEFSGVGLNEIIALGAKRWPHCDPVAWAPEWPGYGLSTTQLRESSLAAGRLIEKTASGWVALGAEKQESMTSTLDKLDAGMRHPEELTEEEVAALLADVTDPNAGMILRDGPAKPKPVIFGIDYAAGCAPSTAKPNPFPTTLRSPDCDSGPSDHLNASRHQMAGMSKS